MLHTILNRGPARRRRRLQALIIAAILLAQPACQSGEPPAQQQNTGTPTPVSEQVNANTSDTEELKQMPPDPIADNLVQVLNDWMDDQEIATIERGVRLRNMWGESNPVSQSYEKIGVRKLLDELKQNSFFKDMQQTQNLNKGHLVTGGLVQTQGDLYDFLKKGS